MLTFVIAYLAVVVFLAATTMQWHVDHNSPPKYLLHDLFIACIWPADLIVRIYRAHKS